MSAIPEPIAAAPDSGAVGVGVAGEAAAALEWAFNPWRERPQAAGIALAVSVLGCAVIANLGLGGIPSVALAIALVAAIAPAFVPIRCRIDRDGIARRGPLGWERRAWADIKRARLGSSGLRVSPFTAARRLDAYRALVLPIPTDRSATLARALGPILAAHGF